MSERFPLRQEIIDAMMTDLIRGGFLNFGDELPDALSMDAVFYLLGTAANDLEARGVATQDSMFARRVLN